MWRMRSWEVEDEEGRLEGRFDLPTVGFLL